MSVDLASATAETFAPHVGSRFALALTDGVLELELLGVEALPAAPSSPRPPFALRFRTPAVPGHLPQGTYALAHAVLGTLEIFLVPLGADAVGMRYEAVFA
ncbi:MAG TPA: hypothetical protein VM261_25695 [Kofleriaceae bacterium]|nr:hypothetical protein [Kofleriaceae bacterium]